MVRTQLIYAGSGAPVPVPDLCAWFLMTLTFAVCAYRIVRTPDDVWDLPPLHTQRGRAASGS